MDLYLFVVPAGCAGVTDFLAFALANRSVEVVWLKAAVNNESLATVSEENQGGRENKDGRQHQVFHRVALTALPARQFGHTRSSDKPQRAKQEANQEPPPG